MEDSRTKNKRILKNTIFMYIRMFVLLLVSLFTARVVLNTLGVSDYGTYGVVASIIVFFSFLNKGLISSTSRYITADIADNDFEKGRKTFNVCLQAHVIIAASIFLLAETVGLWCVNYILKIPEGREFAANVVYQLSVMSAIVAIFQSPYGAAITAFEKMNIYSYFSIVEAVMKLLIVYLVQIIEGDKLIIYGILLWITQLISILFYHEYAVRNLPICRFYRYKNAALLKDIFKFMSWSTFGQAMVVGTNQGASVLVNVYHSVIANAAMGISGAITGTVGDFVNNFQTAFRPQIIKSYATKDFDYLQTLMLRSSKITSFLVIAFMVPVLFEVDNVLLIWLGETYPALATNFCRWTMIGIYLDAVTGPLWIIMYAQTNIRNYQLVTSSIYSLNFLGGWLIYALGAEAYQIIQVRCVVFFALIFVRLYFVKKIFPQFSCRTWFFQIFGGGILLIAVTSSLVWAISNYLHGLNIYLHVVAITVLALLVLSVLILGIGLNNYERKTLMNFVSRKIHLS